MLDLASRFADGRLTDSRLRTLSDDGILDELSRVPGIGPWTVQGALLIALRRPDVLPAGDLVLRRALRHYYGLDHLPTEREIADLTAAWRPHRSLGANLLFAAIERDRTPRRPHGSASTTDP